MLKLACCCAVALIVLQISCGKRQPPAQDGAADGSAQPRDGGDQRDGTGPQDLQPPQDAPPNPALFIKLNVIKLYANCMPSVPPDPVQFLGNVELLNNGGTALGPIQFSGGTLRSGNDVAAAAFDVKPIASYVIKPAEGLSQPVEKVPGSLKGVASACGLCGKSFRVALTYAGAGIPAGARVRSALVKLNCAY